MYVCLKHMNNNEIPANRRFNYQDVLIMTVNIIISRCEGNRKRSNFTLLHIYLLYQSLNLVDIKQKNINK